MAAPSPFELHPDRLSTSDENGRRIYVHPADVHGRYRRRRMGVQWALVFVFLALPWLRIQGRQALLFDIPNREFEIFGLSLRAHNAPLLVLVFGAAIFALSFATALFGRVWCGWACPQTVFIDRIYRTIERWIEGSALERKKLDAAPFSFKKILKRGFKWLLFLLVTLVITHSFLAYFVGTTRLREMIFQPPSRNLTDFAFVMIATAIVYFDFAWFREQFCTIVCPYGRFQSVLMDKGSLIVAFDSARGEPRATPQAKALAKTHNTKLGDCVNCYRCVQVCPTGIDIRRGLQLECIACTSCIDACDEVMTKLKNPTGLIRYDSLLGLEGKKRKISARAISYLVLFIACFATLIALVYLTPSVGAVVLRAKDVPYSVQADVTGEDIVTNHFKIEFSNQSGSSKNLIWAPVNSDVLDGVKVITALQPFALSDDTVSQADIFIRFPKRLLKRGTCTVHIEIHDASDPSINIIKEVELVGPLT